MTAVAASSSIPSAPPSAVLRGPAKPALSTTALHWLGFSIEQFVHTGLGQRISQRARDSLLAEMARRQPVDYEQMPAIAAADVTPREFIATYVRDNRPVVLRGFARDWPAVGAWDFDFFRRELGDYTIPTRLNARSVSTADLEGELISFAECIDRIERGEDVYAQNLQGVFKDHPRLKDDLRLDRVRDYLCRHRWSPITSTQLFVSNQNARTFYHCAPSVNMFTQLHGAKRWFMVDPTYSAWMHMMPRKDTFYLQSPIDWRHSTDEQRALGQALYAYIPKYVADVHAGDAIFVPQWWWHAVENLGRSIGVSTHAFNGVFTGHNYMAILGLLNRPVWENVLDVLRNGTGTDASLVNRVFNLKS